MSPWAAPAAALGLAPASPQEAAEPPRLADHPIAVDEKTIHRRELHAGLVLELHQPERRLLVAAGAAVHAQQVTIELRNVRGLARFRAAAGALRRWAPRRTDPAIAGSR